METMKHEPGKKPPPPATKPPHPLVADLTAMEGIPIYQLWFKPPHPDLPLRESAGGMGTLRARKDREITLLPKMDCFRVTVTSLDDKIGTKRFYIPRDWATYEPLDGQPVV